MKQFTLEEIAIQAHAAHTFLSTKLREAPKGSHWGDLGGIMLLLHMYVKALKAGGVPVDEIVRFTDQFNKVITLAVAKCEMQDAQVKAQA